MLSAAKCCELTVTTHLQTAWKKFIEFSHPSTSKKTHGHVYSFCLLSAMLHVSETWLSTRPNFLRLQCNYRVMIRQICKIKPKDVATERSRKLVAKLELEDLDLILKVRRLCWYRHVECSSGAVRSACDMEHTGRGGPR